MVCGDEIPSWIPDDRDVELLETIDHVYPEAILVNQAMLIARVVDASIYASAHVSIYCQMVN
jgi:hypothetical protein